MKVVVFSKYGMSTNQMYQGVHQGLKELGIPFCDINIMAERYGQSRPSPKSIPQLKPSSRFQKQDQGILERLWAFQPDLILITQAEGLCFLVDHGPEIKRLKAIVAYWLCDLAYQVFPNQALGQLLDFMFLTNQGQIPKYQKQWGIKNIFYMPQGFIPYPPGYQKKERSKDLVFLGRRYPGDRRYNERNRFLDQIAQKFDYTERDDVPSEKMSQFLSDFKIVLGMNWRNDVELYTSDRLFLVLGAGAFYLTHYFPGLERLFQNRRHLVWFKNIDEAEALIRYFLKNDQERESIAQQGYLLALQKHTYRHRLKNIFDIISKKTDRFYGFLEEE